MLIVSPFLHSWLKLLQHYEVRPDGVWLSWVSFDDTACKTKRHLSSLLTVPFPRHLDELGRGTSTFDGTAIAGASVKHLVERSRCLSLFATHYHSLLDEWKNEPKVRLGHMQCLVEDESDDGADSSITFLYTLGPGTCPKSFGINVARLASLPAEVLSNAKKVSEEFEEEMKFAQQERTAASIAMKKKKIMEAIQKGNWEELLQFWQEFKK